MARKRVLTLDVDKTVALGGTNSQTGKPNPKEQEGYYLGRTERGIGKFGKPNVLFVFLTPEGNVGVWKRGNMDTVMNTATIGARTWLTHNGMKPSKFGPQNAYVIDDDKDDTIVVPDFNAKGAKTTSSEDDQDYSTGYDGSDDDEEQEETDQEAPPPPRVAALGTPASRQAKLQELLGKKAK